VSTYVERSISTSEITSCIAANVRSRPPRVGSDVYADNPAANAALRCGSMRQRSICRLS